MLRPLLPVALAVLLVAGGCDLGREERGKEPAETPTVAAPRGELLASGEAARAVRAQLRNDARGTMRSVDCSQHEGRDRVLCNVEFRSSCDTYLAMGHSSGRITVQRPDYLTICVFTTESVED
jgi:hypothetical protein